MKRTEPRHLATHISMGIVESRKDCINNTHTNDELKIELVTSVFLFYRKEIFQFLTARQFKLGSFLERFLSRTRVWHPFSCRFQLLLVLSLRPTFINQVLLIGCLHQSFYLRKLISIAIVGSHEFRRDKIWNVLNGCYLRG